MLQLIITQYLYPTRIIIQLYCKLVEITQMDPEQVKVLSIKYEKALNQISKLIQKLRMYKSEILPQKDKIIETANIQIAALTKKVADLEQENEELRKQQEENKQTIIETVNLAYKSGEVLRQKSRRVEQQNEQIKTELEVLELKLQKSQSDRKSQNIDAPNNAISKQIPPTFTYESKFIKIAKDHNIDPQKVLSIYFFFTRGLLEQKFAYKLKIVQQIQNLTKRRIKATKPVYEYDPHNTASFHTYIDQKQHLVCVLKTVHKVHLAVYYSGKYTSSDKMKLPALLFALKNDQVFEVHTKTTNPFLRSQRAMFYDEQYLIWGNADVRIKGNELYSTFGEQRSLFNARGLKLSDLIGETEQKTVELEGYEIFQITFESQQ